MINFCPSWLKLGGDAALGYISVFADVVIFVAAKVKNI